MLMESKNFVKLLATASLLLGTSVAVQGQHMIREDFLPPTTQMMMAAPQAPASAPTVTHDREWYAAKTYTWTDAAGATHTASLVDEVTNPYQMYDMLKWVYCNPEIPGNKTTAVTGSNVYYGEQYLVDRQGWLFPTYYHVDPGWGITDNDVTAPYEDGHTLFLIKLKNYTGQPTEYTYSKADIVTYLSNYIESIQLIADGMRVGSGSNAGTMVNIEGEFNRFFVIGKGKSYYWEPQYNSETPPLAPFYNMFEEYSPTTTDAGAEITDFYESMNDGEVYPTIHDCGSVIYFGHYFSMDGKDGTEEKSLSGMILFIPDSRNKYNSRDYDVDHQPMVGMYTIQLDAEAAAAQDQEATYDVTLVWTSSLNTVVNAVVPQTYTVYVVITDENGNQHYELLTETTETTYTYQVPQQDHSYTIDYIVHGSATDNDAFSTWSNIDGVIIPGTNDFLYLTLNHYESDYRADLEMNYYRNFMTLENEDAINALTPERVINGENSFTLYRFDINEPDVMIPVALVTLSVAGNGVHYEIAYDNQELNDQYDYSAPVEGDLTLTGGVIDLGNLMLVDQFAASTALNEHPARYGYMLAQTGIENAKSTNTVEVPVLKTGSHINGYYTLDEVMADTDASLHTGVKNAAIEMNLANNPAIYYYTVERGDNIFPNEAISKLQRRQDGTFMEMNDRMGMAGNIYDEGDFSILDELEITGAPGDYMSYLPVIWTFGHGRVAHDGKENSYGSPIWKTGVGNIDAVVNGVCTEGTTGEWNDEAGHRCRIYYPTITAQGYVPEDASVVYEPFMFRVWRICDGVRGYVFDGNKPVNDLDADRDAFKLIIEEMSTEDAIEVGGDYQTNPIGFGALKDADISFKVRFYYKKVGDKRLTADGTAADEAPLYYVVERTVNWEEIPTGINEIKASNVVSKTYVNAQGIKSDKPFDGLNIVITRYSDGSTRTTKVVK